MNKTIEIGFGLIFLVGAVFNAAYTLQHSTEFYGSFADKALLAPASSLIRGTVIPQARLFTVLLIVFQLVVAFCILSRGRLVVPGLIAGAVFAFGAAFVSNAGGAIGNLLMGIAQAYLAAMR